MTTNTSCATNDTALGEITRDDILAAVEKMRAIPKLPTLDDVVFVIGDDVPMAEAGPTIAFDGVPVRVIRSPYAKGITPLPASVLDPPGLMSVPFEKYEPKEPNPIEYSSCCWRY